MDSKDVKEINFDAVCPPVKWDLRAPEYGERLLRLSPPLGVFVPVIALPPVGPCGHYANKEYALDWFRHIVRLIAWDGTEMNADVKLENVMGERVRRFPSSPNIWPVGTTGMVNLGGRRPILVNDAKVDNANAHANAPQKKQWEIPFVGGRRMHPCTVVGHAQVAIADEKDAHAHRFGLRVRLEYWSPTCQVPGLTREITVDPMVFCPFANQQSLHSPDLLSICAPNVCRVLVTVPLDMVADRDHKDDKDDKKTEVGYVFPLTDVSQDYSNELKQKEAAVWTRSLGMQRMPVSLLVILPFKKGDRIWVNGQRSFFGCVQEQRLGTMEHCGWSYVVRDDDTGSMYDVAHRNSIDVRALIHHLPVVHSEFGSCRLSVPLEQNEPDQKQLDQKQQNQETGEKIMVQIVPQTDAWSRDVKDVLLNQLALAPDWILRFRSAHKIDGVLDAAPLINYHQFHFNTDTSKDRCAEPINSDDDQE